MNEMDRGTGRMPAPRGGPPKGVAGDPGSVPGDEAVGVVADLPAEEPPWPRFLLLPAAALVVAALSALRGAQAPATGRVPAESGAPTAQVLAANGCTGCHGVDGSEDPSRPRAPTLAGALATAAARLASPGYDGAATTPLDYLRESVVDHCTWVVPGYSCSGVQAYGNWLSPDEVEAVVSAAAALPATP